MKKEQKICQNPNCRTIIVKEEWQKGAYHNDLKWTRLKYCGRVCKVKMQYVRRKPKLK